MCPLCISAAALTAAGITSGAGVTALVARRWRALGQSIARASGGSLGVISSRKPHIRRDGVATRDSLPRCGPLV
jgi:hypothetical protein